MSSINKRLVIVIPIFNEEAAIRSNLDRYKLMCDSSDFKHTVSMVFVDGGSSDQSIDILEKHNFHVVRGNKGRAKQQNIGADYFAQSYDVILFLHADTFFIDSFHETLALVLNQKWGFFKLKLSNRRFIYRMISGGINFRSWLFKRGTGDQALFFSQETFEQLRGFGDLALMEDVDICSRAKKICKPKIIPAFVQTSSRRWEENGAIRTVLSMWFFQICFSLGVNSQTIERWYYSKKS